MEKNTKIRLLFWLPRGLAIAAALFHAIFLLEGVEGWTHIIPVAIILVPLFLLWKNPAAETVVFLVLAVLATFYFHTYRQWAIFLAVSAPLLLAGILFGLEFWRNRTDIRMG